MRCGQPQAREVGAAELANRRERLGSRSEVQSFGVELRHRLLIVGFAADETAELLNELPVGSPVGRTDTHVYAVLGSLALQIVRAARAWEHLDPQHLGAAPRQDLKGTSRGVKRSLIMLATRSSRARGSATPRTCRLL